MTLSTKTSLSKENKIKVETIIEKMEADVEKGLFSAWSASNSNFQLSAFWADECAMQFRLESEDQHPIFDLASLSKPLFCGLLLLAKSSERLTQILKAKPLPSLGFEKSFRSNDLTMLELLNHNSGLPAWTWFGRGLFNKEGKPIAGPQSDASIPLSAENLIHFRSQLMSHILEKGTVGPDNRTTVRYSDCGYYLLAKALEQNSSAHGLNGSGFKGWRENLAELNQKLGSHFFHSSLQPRKSALSAPFFPVIVTEQEEAFDSKSSLSKSHKHFGAVLDTNANLLSAIRAELPELGGHAGMFGTVSDVKKAISFAKQRLEVHESQIEMPDKNERFVLGYDTISGNDSLSGIAASDAHTVRGHLGYAGTSYWFDQKSEHGKHNILLTNRTAHRSVYRKQEASRLLLIETKNEKQFAILKGSQVEPLCFDDWQEIRQSEYQSSLRFWNDAHCEKIPQYC